MKLSANKLLLVLIILIAGFANIKAQSLIIPADSSDEVSIIPEFKWNSIDTTVGYELVVSENASYSSPVLNLSLTDTVFNTSLSTTNFPLNFNTVYYVKLKAIFSTSSDSIETLFTTISELQPQCSYVINGETATSLKPTLSWYFNDAVGNSIHRFEYSTNNDLSDSVSHSTGTNRSYTLTNNLIPGLMYYWRVLTYSASGALRGISDIDSFFTPGGVSKPIQTWPINDGEVYTNSPTLWWYVDLHHNSFSYEIEIDTKDNPLTGAPDYTGITASNFQVAGLIPGKEYHWAVRVNNGNTVSDFAVDSFITAGAGTPLKPVISYPNNSAIVYTTAPVLWWYINGVSTNLEYNIYYRKTGDAAFTQVNGISSLNHQLIGLDAGTEYEWYVESVSTNGGGTSDPSEIDTFVTAGAVSDLKPVAAYPVDSAVVYSITPILWWYINAFYASVSYYEIEVSENDQFLSTVVDTTSSGGGLTITTPLNYGETYFWRVRTVNISNNSSDWSDPEPFIIAEPTGDLTPIPTYPTGGEVVFTDDPTLSWYVNGSQTSLAYFELLYSRTGAFVNDTDYTRLVTSESSTKTLGDLYSGATYYWKVRSVNKDSVRSPWSSIETFVVQSGVGSVTPMVGGPNNVSIDTDKPMLTWFTPIKLDDNQVYTLQYSENRDFNVYSIIEDINSDRYILDGLKNGQTYYWRVKAKTTDKAVSKESGYSGVGRFTVSNITDSEEIYTLPVEYKLEQNYPNPFNPSTTISFIIPEKGNVSLVVYNLLGEKIITLVNQEMNPGNHKAYWNGLNSSGIKVSSGIYIYKLSTNNFTMQKKMILLK